MATSSASNAQALSNVVTQEANALTDNCHNYTGLTDSMTLCVSDEDFPSLPITPSKPPASKKGMFELGPDATANKDVIDTLSRLINARSEAIEKMDGDNARGLRNNVQCKAFFLFAKQLKTDECFFQESHSVSTDVNFWRRAPEWRSSLRHCFSVLEASLQTMV